MPVPAAGDEVQIASNLELMCSFTIADWIRKGGTVRIRSQLHYLTAYSAIVTAAFAMSIFWATVQSVRASSKPKTDQFDRIIAHRIDLVEPDGLPRLIISNRAEFPGEYFHGKEVTRRDRSDSAGILFMNDEGTEDGGLIYGGSMVDGKPYSFSHLSFDQYDQDQTIDIGTELRNGTRTSGFVLNDMPEKPITPDLIEEASRIKEMPHGSARADAWSRFQRIYPAGTARAAFERNPDGSISLALKDKGGQNRLVMSVDGNGTPTIQFLDDHGRALRTLSMR